MSICFCIFLLFLCILVLECNAARPFNAIDKKLQNQLHSQYFNKNDEKNDMSKTPVALRPKSSMSNELEGAKEESIPAETTVVNDDQKPENTKDGAVNEKKSRINDEREKNSSGAIRTESLSSSVYWHLPHYKPGEKHPGFSSDYSPPKTHPPTHN